MSYRHKERAHISGRKFRLLLGYFSLDLDALTISKLARLNRNTVNKYLRLFRERIAELCDHDSPFKGVVEFAAKRIKSKRGRGASEKTPVFGILQRGSTVLQKLFPIVLNVRFKL